MTLLYYDNCFLAHDTGDHPECAERLRRTRDHLVQSGLVDRCRSMPVVSATKTDLQRVHAPDYIQQLKAFAAVGGGQLESDTVVSTESYAVAKKAAGAACDAVRRVVGGEDSSALCLVRPPGHHAVPRSAMGFCLFNNVAVAAKTATSELGLNRVLIIDWDVHHGNGTQDMFWHDPQIGFFSIHRFPFYPGTGAADETGSGPGLGSTVNLPVAFGTPRGEYLARFQSELAKFADRIKPELLLISAGFDSHRRDPVGSLGLETEDFGWLTDCALSIAESHCQGRVVSVLEGGYNTRVLPDCVETHLEELLAATSTKTDQSR